MIELILGAMVISAVFCTVPKAVADAYASYRAARTDQWDVVERGRDRPGFTDRLGQAWAARRAQRSRQAGGDGTVRPGVGAYAKDLYHGWFEDRLERRAIRRAARPPYDPTAPTWADQVDAKLIALVKRLRERREAATERQNAPVDAAVPVEIPPGAVTFDDTGRMVPAPTNQPAPPRANSPRTNPTPINPTITEDTMTAPTTPAAVATEVNTNEDARTAFKAQLAAATVAADALAAYEQAQMALAAQAAAATDGLAAKRFDRGATAAQANVADLLPASGMASAAAAIEAMRAEAEAGLQSLEKWRDSEDQIASEQVDTSTLAATSS